MSFASVSGSSIGQHLTLPFSGNNDGIAMGTPEVVVSQAIDHGAWIFSANFSIFTSKFSPASSTLSAQAVITYGNTVLAKLHIDNQFQDDVCLTGMVFSDGAQSLTLTITATYAVGESAVGWGFSDGKIDLVRLTQSF